MTKRLLLATALLALTGPLPGHAQPAATQAAAPALPAWLDAADRGEMGPLSAALRTSGNRDERLLLEARLAASRGEAVHRRPELLRLASAADPGVARAALNIIASGAFGQNDYAAAARASGTLADRLRAAGHTAQADAVGRVRDLAALLADAPAQRVDGQIALSSTPLTRDAVGLPRIRIGVNGGEDEAVIDTGAGLTVLSAETAGRLGVVPIEGDTRVGNGVASTVAVRTGIVDRMTIAGTTLRNVPVLIIDDEQLTFPQAGGYRITSIVGLPVLRALQRVKLDDALFAVEAPQSFDPARQNMFADSNDLHVRVSIGGRDTALFIDTGANALILTQRFAAAHPELIAELTTEELRTASAGGARSQRAAVWTNPQLTIGGHSAIIPSVRISLEEDDLGREHAGVLSSSALRRFRSHTFDFRAMRLEMGEAVAEPAPPR